MTTAKAHGNTIKHVLRTKHGLTLTELAAQGGWNFRDVSDTVRGIRQANFGKGREIAEKIKELTGLDVTRPESSGANQQAA